jgi:hypothetical protein
MQNLRMLVKLAWAIGTSQSNPRSSRLSAPHLLSCEYIKKSLVSLPVANAQVPLALLHTKSLGIHKNIRNITTTL